MSYNVESNLTAGELMPPRLRPEDGSLAWYQVVGIEFILFAAIVVPLLCGALLAR